MRLTPPSVVTLAVCMLAMSASTAALADGAVQIDCIPQWTSNDFRLAQYNQLAIVHAAHASPTAQWFVDATKMIGFDPTAADHVGVWVDSQGVYRYLASTAKKRNFGPDISDIYFNTWLTETSLTTLTIDPTHPSSSTIHLQLLRKVDSSRSEFRESEHTTLDVEVSASCTIKRKRDPSTF